MRIVFEEHQYQASDVHEVLHGICALQDVEKMVSVNYVGYFYNSRIHDCVFILPKVLLTDKKKDEEDTVPNEYILDGNKKLILQKLSIREGKRHIYPKNIVSLSMSSPFGYIELYLYIA